jgi:hypothetical protein
MIFSKLFNIKTLIFIIIMQTIFLQLISKSVIGQNLTVKYFI